MHTLVSTSTQSSTLAHPPEVLGPAPGCGGIIATVTPVEPKPTASVLLVRPGPADAPEPIEVYVIRRNKGMKFLGGYYAFPAGGGRGGSRRGRWECGERDVL